MYQPKDVVVNVSCDLQCRSHMIKWVDIETEGHMTFLLSCTSC